MFAVRVRQKRAKMALLTNTPRGRFRKEISGTMKERESEKERGKDYRMENCVTSSCPPWLCICVFTFQLWFYPRQPQDVTDLKEEVKLKCLEHSRLDSRLIETKSMKVCIHMIHVRFTSVSNNVCKLFSRTSGIGYNYI